MPHGSYRRSCDSRTVERFRCRLCGKTFSNQTFNPTYRQLRPRINHVVRRLLCSKVSMRRIAVHLGIDRKTVKRKFLYHAEQARLRQKRRLEELADVDMIMADEMETFEHTKCKPLSIALAVVPGSRIILGAVSSEMPAKGPLADISRKKYGLRRDDRKDAFKGLLASVRKNLTGDVWVLTDKKSAYRTWVRDSLPGATHYKVKGQRGCIAGYGEMKKTGFDPLFYLNHTAAMVRDNLARMLRRTWCGSKMRTYLQEALDLYVDFHNEMMERLPQKAFDRERHLNLCRLYQAVL